MKRIIILGAGNVGKAIAYDLHNDYELTIGDNHEKRLDKLNEYGTTKIIDASNEDEVRREIKRYDLVVSALPGNLGYDIVKNSIELGKDIVDVSFMPEDPLKLDEKAKKKGVTAIVDAGFGPGMSNVFMGEIANNLDSIKRAIIRIGGLPKNPEPPLFYKITWSPHDLIEEYVRPARIIREGKIVEIDPFEKIKEITIKNFEFEEFYSDGLRTLLYTIPNVEYMEETTLRWPGHLNKMKVLRELGFFDEKNIEDTLEVITPKMEFESDDFSIMDIEVEGILKKEKKTIKYFFYDEADEGFSSMSRSTGFTTATFARLILENQLEKGVLPPELLGMDKGFYQYITQKLKQKGITIERRES
ncbi:MAG: saccharopine dehydrogenase family protein [Thermoplasmatota archaeon]